MDKKQRVIEFLLNSMSSKEDLDILRASFENRIQLLEILFELTNFDNNTIAWRAYWTFEHCIESKEQAAYFLNDIVNNLNVYKTDGLKRHALKIVLMFNPNEYDTVKIIDYCFNILENRANSIAVKANAMSILYAIGEQQHEILYELKALIELNLSDASPGIKNKSLKLLEKISKRI